MKRILLLSAIGLILTSILWRSDGSKQGNTCPECWDGDMDE